METLFTGANVIFLPEVNSTNSYAINLLKNVNLPEGTVVYAAHQTHGRGQRGNVWNTLPDSNLTASVIFKPTFLPVNKQFLLYQISALACYDVMAEFIAGGQFDIKIKWPNDILVDKKKIAGILIENSLSGKGRIEASVIGVGINVKQQEFDGILKATSIEKITGKYHAVQQVLQVLCKHLEKYYLYLKSQKYELIKLRYLECFFGLNMNQDFEINGEFTTRKISGISEDGLLLLSNEKNEVFEYDVKDVKWLL
jgi:BirA family transcriptional regulator, biotin operon repressor / biotin---[acetyl-CoA-carboxylase] ligase